MNNIFHLLGGYKNVFRFQMAVAIVACVLGAVYAAFFLQSIYQLKHSELDQAVQFLGVMTVFCTTGALIVSSYYLVLKAIRQPLSEATIKKLARDVVQHYKTEAITYSLHHPITWSELYSYMKFLEKQQKSEAKKAFEQKVLAQQKTWLKDLV